MCSGPSQTTYQEVSRRSRAVDVRNCTKNRLEKQMKVYCLVHNPLGFACCSIVVVVVVVLALLKIPNEYEK